MNKGEVRKRMEERMDGGSTVERKEEKMEERMGGGSIVERMEGKMEERMDVRNSEW